MYNVVYIGLWLILSTIVIQFFVVTWLHRTQKRYKVGYIDPELGQASLLFRAHRTFWNSIENIIPMFGMSLIAILAEYDPKKLSILVWLYAIMRILHMIIYYKIATEKNPSLRSIPWAIGFLAGFYFMIDLGVYLLI